MNMARHSRIRWGLQAESVILVCITGIITVLAAQPLQVSSHNITLRRQPLALQISALVLQDGGIKVTTAFPRRDPLDRFKIYEGGFNIKDKHYWSSVMFTGIWAFVMAIFCFCAGFISLAWYWCLKFSCIHNPSLKLHPYLHPEALRSIRFCVLQFSIFAMKLGLVSTAITISTLVLGGLLGILKVWDKPITWIFGLMACLLIASWILAGLGFILSNVITDTCQAMRDYQNDSQNSSLAILLPCLTPRDAILALNEAKFSIKSLISQTNVVIDMVNSHEQQLVRHAGSTNNVTLKHICDPYGPPPEFLEITCPIGTSNFTTFKTDYVKYKCINDVVSYCLRRSTPIPYTYYQQFILSMLAAKDVFHTLPSLFDILTCTFVHKDFKELTSIHCGNMLEATNMVWIGFTAASITLMPLLVLWIILRIILGKFGRNLLTFYAFFRQYDL